MHDDTPAGRTAPFGRCNPAWTEGDDAGSERKLAFGIVCELAAASFDAALVSISLGVRGDQVVLLERGGGDGIAARRLGLHDDAWGQREPLVIADLRTHKRLRHLPEVNSDGGLRFYAGVPLACDGEAIGVHGINPRNLEVRQHEQLARFGLLVEQLLDQHGSARRLHDRLQLVEQAASLSHVGAWLVDLRYGSVSWSRETYALLEVPGDVTPAASLIGSFWTEASRKRGRTLVDALLDRGIGFDEILEVRTTRGRVRRMRIIGSAELVNGRVARAGGSVQLVD